MLIEAWTDGSGDIRSPKIGGWAVVIRSKDNPLIIDNLSGATYNTTSARMEMTAVIMALRWPSKPTKIAIHCDSAYVVNCITDDWLSGWRRRGWMTSRDEPVKNVDLWEEMARLIAWHEAVQMVKVKGHSGNEFNELADRMASEARKNKRKEHDYAG